MFWIWFSSKTDMFRHGHVNDDEIGEYSRSSSDVLNCNSKQKKKGTLF